MTLYQLSKELCGACVCVCLQLSERPQDLTVPSMRTPHVVCMCVSEGGLWQPSRWVPIVAGMVLSAACKMQCLSTYMKLLLCTCRVSN